MNILVTELISVNYKLCSHCGPTKEDIPTLQSDVITKVRRTSLCVIHPTANADWWPCPVKTPSVGSMNTPPPRPAPSFLLNFLPPKVLSVSTPAQTPHVTPQCSGTKLLTIWIIAPSWLLLLIIHNRGFIAPRCHVGQRNMTPRQRVAGRVGLWSHVEGGGEGLIWHSSLGLP